MFNFEDNKPTRYEAHVVSEIDTYQVFAPARLGYDYLNYDDMVEEDVVELMEAYSKVCLYRSFLKWIQHFCIDSEGNLETNFLENDDPKKQEVIEKYKHLVLWYRDELPKIKELKRYLRLEQRVQKYEDYMTDPYKSIPCPNVGYPAGLNRLKVEGYLRRLCENINFQLSDIPKVEIFAVSTECVSLDDFIPGVSWRLLEVKEVKLAPEVEKKQFDLDITKNIKIEIIRFDSEVTEPPLKNKDSSVYPPELLQVFESFKANRDYSPEEMRYINEMTGRYRIQEPMLTPLPLRSELEKIKGKTKYVGESCSSTETMQVYQESHTPWAAQLDLESFLDYEEGRNKYRNEKTIRYHKEVKDSLEYSAKYALKKCFEKWLSYTYKIETPISLDGDLHPIILEDTNLERLIVIHKNRHLLNLRDTSEQSSISGGYDFQRYYSRWRKELKEKYGFMTRGSYVGNEYIKYLRGLYSNPEVDFDPYASTPLTDDQAASALEGRLSLLCNNLVYCNSQLPTVELVTVAPVSQYLENIIPGVSWMFVCLDDLEIECSEDKTFKLMAQC